MDAKIIDKMNPNMFPWKITTSMYEGACIQLESLLDARIMQNPWVFGIQYNISACLP